MAFSGVFQGLLTVQGVLAVQLALFLSLVHHVLDTLYPFPVFFLSTDLSIRQLSLCLFW